MKSRKWLIFLSVFFLCAAPGLFAELVDWTLATIDRQTVTFYEFQDAYTEIRVMEKEMGAPRSSTAEILDQLISNRILKLEAEDLKIDVSEDEVNERIELFKQMNNLNNELFKQVLKREGLKLSELKDKYREQIRTQKLQEMEIMPRVRTPSEDMMKKFYEEHKSEMRTPERIRVSHILMRDNQDASLAERQEVKRRIQEARDRAVKGEDFSSLVKEYSDDEATRDRGGDLGWIRKGEIAEEFESQIFTMKKGQISPVVSTRWGMHVAKVVDRIKSGSMSFEEAKLEIRARLMQDEAEKEFLRWIEQKKRQYGIRVILSAEQSVAFRNGAWIDENTKKPVSEKEMAVLLDKALK